MTEEERIQILQDIRYTAEVMKELSVTLDKLYTDVEKLK